MKIKERGLLYHTLHSRPMPGCLPLFFLMALVVVGLGLWLAPVEMPERVHPRGNGQVLMKNDRLTRFLLQRRSPLPLHLPHRADPEYQEDAAAASMPLLRPETLLPPPPQPVYSQVADSVVLNAEDLLALPGDATPGTVESTTPVPEPPAEPAASGSAPVFHPGVEKELENGEEVQP